MANTSFSSILSLLLLFLSWLCPAYQDEIEIEKKALFGQQVNLTCQTNSTADVIWKYFGPTSRRGRITCPYPLNSQCTSDNLDFQATRNKGTSSILITAAQEEQTLQCFVGTTLVKSYNLISVDPNDIVPNCTITLPKSDGVLSMELSCGVNSFGVNVSLTFEGIGLDIPDTPGSSQSIRTKTLYFGDFDIRNASCNAYVPGFNITRSCNYPNIGKSQYITEGNDIIVECDVESEVDWHLFNSDGREEEIKNRSWTRGGGGRSLLIRDISVRDVGKVVVCQPRGDNLSNGTITFTVISEIPRDTNEANSGDSQPGPGDRDHFLVPALLFLALWLITTAVGGVWFGCRHHRSNSSTWPTRNASVPNAPSESNVNGDANDRETSLADLARVRVGGDPDTSNTNNSASNFAFELEGEGPDENRLNRQSNNGSHLYVTLEKPSPSAESSRMASTSGIGRREDTNLASLNQPQSGHWQGYETVGESDKGAACSYDIGEYAEVGDHLIGRSLANQSLRPPIRTPGKEEIKEDDISRLYDNLFPLGHSLSWWGSLCVSMTMMTLGVMPYWCNHNGQVKG